MGLLHIEKRVLYIYQLVWPVVGRLLETELAFGQQFTIISGSIEYRRNVRRKRTLQ